MTGRIPAAAAETEREMELDPLNVTCRRTVLSTYMRREYLGRAFAEVRGTLEIDPNNGVTQAVLARLHVSTGQLHDARTSFERTHKLVPWNAHAGIMPFTAGSSTG